MSGVSIKMVRARRVGKKSSDFRPSFDSLNTGT